MAIQVTGSFKIGYASYENPQLQLIPNLTYRGGIAMNINTTIPVKISSGIQSGSIGYVQVGTIPMYPTTSDLSYPQVPTDPYSDLIWALEKYVIDNLQPINSGSIFNRF